jgi:hypothetical protein
MESLGDDVGRETVDKGGAEGLITTLPVRDGMDKKVASFTRDVIQYDGDNVNTKVYKHDPEND